jgi:hypothetical protein
MKALQQYVGVWITGLILCALAACVAPHNNPPEVTSQSVSATTPANGAKLTSVTSLSITYASAVDQASAQQALTLYTGDYDLSQNPATFYQTDAGEPL